MIFSFREVFCLGLFTSVAIVAQDLRHNFQYTPTEDENEFDNEKRIQVNSLDTLTASTATNFFVGGFRLTSEDGFALEACDLIVDQFESKTDCTCSLSTLHSSSVQFGCENKHTMCNPWDFCARPVYAGTVSLEDPVSSSNVCLKNLQNRQSQQKFGDLCVVVDHDRNEVATDEFDSTMKRCKAQIGRHHCNCTICGGGTGIRLDCSDSDIGLISTQCDGVSLVNTIKGQQNMVGGYFPSFQMQA
jgi:hypothetical protein